MMDVLPMELCLKILSFLDYQNLATLQQVSWKWKALGSDDILWAQLFEKRWGQDQAIFYDPRLSGSGSDSASKSKSWKDVYQVQDRCDRVGLGLKIIREGVDYYLVHQGEIQRYLGSRTKKRENPDTIRTQTENQQQQQEGRGPGNGILDQILFFIGDMEVATLDAKRKRKRVP